jgi:hypothetical protein
MMWRYVNIRAAYFFLSASCLNCLVVPAFACAVGLNITALSLLPMVMPLPLAAVVLHLHLQYMLGYVDEPEKPTDMLRHRFPSKVGGPPVGVAQFALSATL